MVCGRTDLSSCLIVSGDFFGTSHCLNLCRENKPNPSNSSGSLTQPQHLFKKSFDLQHLQDLGVTWLVSPQPTTRRDLQPGHPERRSRLVFVVQRCNFIIVLPRRSWTLLSRGRTLLSRSPDPQICRVLRDQELFGASG